MKWHIGSKKNLSNLIPKLYFLLFSNIQTKTNQIDIIKMIVVPREFQDKNIHQRFYQLNLFVKIDFICNLISTNLLENTKQNLSVRHIYLFLMKTDFESSARSQEHQRAVTQCTSKLETQQICFLINLFVLKSLNQKSRIIKNS